MNYYHDALKNSKGNTKKMWKSVKEISGLNKVKQTSISKLVENDINCTNDKDLAHMLNTCSYFANAANRVLSNIDHTSYQPSPEFKNFLENTNIIQDTFVIPLVTEQQVCLYLEDLDPKKAAGINNIGAPDLKGIKPCIVKHLCNIVNTNTECETFRKPWKEAKFTPFHKGGSIENIDNYRPISVLPTASKILEHHVHKYLYNYFCDNNLLCNNQSGFGKKHCCSTCLTYIMEYCYDNINNLNIVGFVALEF